MKRVQRSDALVKIRKTVVGSFPKLANQIDEALKKAIDIQLRSGIEIVSDGEQRADMIEYFEQIPGMARGLGELRIQSKISPPQNPSEIVKVKDFMLAKDYVKKLGKGDVAIKTAITGPITLGVTCAASGLKHYSGLTDIRLYSDLSEALEPILIELLRLGSFVQLDEPGLSAGYMAPSQALPIIHNLFDRIAGARTTPGSISIHVCGSLKRLPKLFEGLLEFNLDVVSLAFSGRTEHENADLISEALFESARKRLGVGCTPVSALNVEGVENVEQIYRRIRTIVDKVGERNIAYAHPDDGFKSTPLEVSELVLQRFSQAVDRCSLQ